jgi:hypothetical protein
MSRRTVKIAVTAAALAFSAGLGLWTATAAPADEVPAPVMPSTSVPAPAVSAPTSSAPVPSAPNPSGSAVTTPLDNTGIISCGLCAVPAI